MTFPEDFGIMLYDWASDSKSKRISVLLLFAFKAALYRITVSKKMELLSAYVMVGLRSPKLVYWEPQRPEVCPWERRPDIQLVGDWLPLASTPGSSNSLHRTELHYSTVVRFHNICETDIMVTDMSIWKWWFKMCKLKSKGFKIKKENVCSWRVCTVFKKRGLRNTLWSHWC